MPSECLNPRYRFKGNTRLEFCGSRVVAVKSKEHIMKEREVGKALNKGPNGGYYYIRYGRKVYV